MDENSESPEDPSRRCGATGAGYPQMKLDMQFVNNQLRLVKNNADL